jgi:hypothetical protein
VASVLESTGCPQFEQNFAVEETWAPQEEQNIKGKV